MKKRFSLALLFATLMTLGACQNTPAEKPIDFDSIESNEYNPATKSGPVGAFDLVSPSNGQTFEKVPAFQWTASSNAIYYKLEICESDDFISDIDNIVYYCQDYITATSFTIQSDLSNKNTTYYWRVFAENSDVSMASTSVFSFYLKAEEKEEVEFDLGDADDWLLHPGGSHAEISIDNSNFFKNDKPSLAITFKKEDTNQGIPSSDGWIIVTKTIEKSIYGTDALLLNFFYAGHDAKLFIRLVDKDNEYWFCEIQISNNARQSVILKFSEFVQRFADVPVANRHFDYERIKYMEVVFERSFGDGVCLISDVRAIKFANYKDRYIDKLHFKDYAETSWSYEAYNFGKQINDDELTLNYSSTEPKINGYGFAKLATNKFFATGDAIKLKVKYTGYKGNNIIVRIYEEDKDRWMYRIPFTSLIEGEYQEIVIPFLAFGKSSFEGDGKRQFYFILNLQFGVEGVYGAGSASFKDFEIVKSKDYKTEEQRIVGDDGIIENFDSYANSTDMYFIWNVSTDNKDEFMTLNATSKTGGSSNKYCAQFEYKQDMEPAAYKLPLKVTGNGFSALSLWLKDASTVGTHAKVDIYIQLVTGEQYVFTIDSLEDSWLEYVIPFNSFVIANRESVAGNPTEITCGGIEGICIALQYFNTGLPQYLSGNIVYVDSIRFTDDTEYSTTEKENVIRMDGDKALIEDAEQYASTTDVLDSWGYASSNGYENVELSDDVSSNGGNKSIKMQYKRNKASISYYSTMKIANDVSAKGITLDIKGDDFVTIYVNLYLNFGGSTIQYRATLDSVVSSWNKYCIGFDNFAVVSGTAGRKLTSKDVPNIFKISFGAVSWCGGGDESLNYFFVDNMAFDATLSYSTSTITPIN